MFQWSSHLRNQLTPHGISQDNDARNQSQLSYLETTMTTTQHTAHLIRSMTATTVPDNQFKAVNEWSPVKVYTVWDRIQQNPTSTNTCKVWTSSSQFDTRLVNRKPPGNAFTEQFLARVRVASHSQEWWVAALDPQWKCWLSDESQSLFEYLSHSVVCHSFVSCISFVKWYT